MKRLLLLAVLLAGACYFTLSQAHSQNTLPPRPPIFLNNNASLYTFPNPNFGKPSQLPFAFVAVAHEDCRLYNNGAKLMPKHRLMAAECIDANNMNINPINPVCQPIGICQEPGREFGRLVFPAGCPRPPGSESTITCRFWIPLTGQQPVPVPGIGGINYARRPMPVPPPPAYVYAGAGGAYTNYGSYNPGATPGSSTSTSDSTMSTQSRQFRGFNLPGESSKAVDFLASVGTEPLTRFGSGFGIGCGCCGMSQPESTEKPGEPASE